MQTFNETDKVQRSEVKRKEGLTNESYNSLTPHPLHPHPPIAPRSNDLDMKTQRKSPSIPGRPADVLSPVNGDKSDRDSFNKDNGKSQSTSKHGNLLQERKIGETPIRYSASKGFCGNLNIQKTLQLRVAVSVHAPIFHG